MNRKWRFSHFLPVPQSERGSDKDPVVYGALLLLGAGQVYSRVRHEGSGGGEGVHRPGTGGMLKMLKSSSFLRSGVRGWFTGFNSRESPIRKQA